MPDPDADQARDGRGPVGDVDARWPAARSGRPTRCRGRPARSPAAGPPRPPSRTRSAARSRRRGSRAPPGWLLLRGVDRVPAEFDLHAPSPLFPRRRRSASRRPPSCTSQPGTVSGASSSRSCRSPRPGSGYAVRRARPARPPRRTRSCARAPRALGRPPGPSRRRRSPAPSSPSKRSSVRSLAALDSEPGVL